MKDWKDFAKRNSVSRPHGLEPSKPRFRDIVDGKRNWQQMERRNSDPSLQSRPGRPRVPSSQRRF
jgi:hypothetical protein